MPEEDYLFSQNAVFVEEMYKRYLSAPSSVPEEWQKYFSSLDDDEVAVNVTLSAPSWRPPGPRIIGVQESSDGSNKDAKSKAAEGESVSISSIADRIVTAYRYYGHTAAMLDPLGLEHPVPASELSLLSFINLLRLICSATYRLIPLRVAYMGLLPVPSQNCSIICTSVIAAELA